MVQLDAIWAAAQSDLTITTKQGNSDVFLWEDSARVTRNALQIAQHSAIAPMNPDQMLLTVVGLYRNVAWADYLREGLVSRAEVLTQQPLPGHREKCAASMKRRLKRLLSADMLQRASAIIHSLGSRHADGIEAQIVSDAEQLDGFGLASLWMSIRRGTAEGVGIDAVLRRWRRRKEYKFWQRQLADSFRLQPVRAMASRRLANLERFMHDLENEQQGLDLLDR